MALHNYDNATQNKQHLRCLPPAVVHTETYVPSVSYELTVVLGKLTSEGRFQAHCDHITTVMLHFLFLYGTTVVRK